MVLLSAYLSVSPFMLVCIHETFNQLPKGWNKSVQWQPVAITDFCCSFSINLPYFFGYKTEFVFLPKQFQRSRFLQDGSRSLKLFRKGKIGIIAKFHRTNLVI